MALPNTNSDMQHLQHVEQIAKEDAEATLAGEAKYEASWKRRGGVDSFMMLARKWDRIETRVGKDRFLNHRVDRWNILQHLEVDPEPTGLIDDIRDLRRYLILVESELRARGVHLAATVVPKEE